MTRVWLLVLLSCAAPPVAVVEKPAPWPVVPAAPEGRLPRTFTPASYAARLAVDPNRPGFAGTIAITGELAEAAPAIWLNAEGLVIHEAHAERDGKRIELRAALLSNGFLAMRARQPLPAGRWKLVVSYSGSWNLTGTDGGFVQSAGSARYAFTMFEPDYARRVFPCADEPDRKVPWQLTLDVPRYLIAASNMPITRERIIDKNTKRVEFVPTPPLSSYLVAFAVGPFEIVDAGRSKAGVPIRILALRDTTQKAAAVAPTVAPLVDRLADWLGVPFPYPKLDLVAVPKTPGWWAAMENPGLITIATSYLTSPGWREVVTHELAHHWFGDLVTLAWWDDIWLNESFAYWIADKIDKLDTPRPFDWRASGFGPSIVAAVPRPRELIGATSRPDRPMLDWHRGTILLDLLQRYLGADRLRAGLRAYLTKHAQGTATSVDLAKALSDASGEDLRALLDGYLHDTSPDVVAMQLRCANGRSTVELPALAKPRFACFAFDRDGKRAEHCTRTRDQSTSIDLGTRQCSRWLISQSSQLDLEPAGLQALLDHAWPQLTEQERVTLAFSVIGKPTLRSMRWVVLERMASSTSIETLAWITRYIATLEKYVAPDLRPKYEAWVRRLFGTRARTIGFANAQRIDAFSLPALVARAGDPTLQREATRLYRPEDKSHHGAELAALVVRIDPRIAEAQFEQLLRTPSILAGAPNLVELIDKHIELVAKLPITMKQLLVRELCSAEQRDAIAKLVPKLALKDSTFFLAHIDDCIAERGKLDRELRDFFLSAR